MPWINATRPPVPGAPGGRGPLTLDDWTRIRALYDEGLTDGAIAEAVGCSSKTIGRWRGAEELPRNDRKASG